MIGLGTIINVAGIIAGGLCGLLFGKRVTERYRSILLSAIGICTLFLGIGGCMEAMLTVEGSKLTTGGSMMMIVCMALGAFLGEWIDLERRLERFGEFLKRRSRSEGDNRFVDGFVTTSMTVCIGAMTVVGSIRDGLTGDYTILAAKTVLDFILVLIMTVSLGKGCMFSALPVVILQGGITLLARLVEPVLTDQALLNLSLVGSMLIFCVGINLVWGKRIRVANMLPAILLAIVWAFLPFA